jgi:flagellar hook-associated protein 1 FlgK
LALAALRDARLVGLQSSGGAVQGGQTITDAYASAIADIGVRVQGAKAAAQTSRSVASAAESARANKAGVNLDEEAARLLQYQQGYQAAAKVLQVAQSVFDALLQATR